MVGFPFFSLLSFPKLFEIPCSFNWGFFHLDLFIFGGGKMKEQAKKKNKKNISERVTVSHKSML